VRPLAALAETWRRGHWPETAPYRAVRLLARLVRLGSFGLLRLPRVYAHSEKNAAGYIDGAYIHTLTGNWVKVEKVSPGRFRQRCSAPPPLRFGLGLLPAPLMAATDLAQITAGTNDRHVWASHAVYATARAATTGTFTHNIDYAALIIGVDYSSSTYYVYRGMIPFDATGLPDTCRITLAHVHVYVTTVYANGDSISIVGPYTGSNPMVEDDFDQIGTTVRGETGCTTTGAKTITLTAFTDISKTVVSRFGVKGHYDAAPHTPSGDMMFNIGSADNSTAPYRPKLDVSYVLDVGRDLDVRYGAGGVVGRDLEIRYAAGAVIGRDLEIRYAAGAVIGRDLDVRFDLSGRGYGRDLQVVYGVSPHFRFVATPAWEAQVGPRPNRVRVLIEGTTTVKTAGAPAANAAIDGPPISVAVDTTAVQAQAVADARLAAYAQNPLRVAGPVLLNALIGFGEALPLYWYEQTWSAGVRTYPLRETANLPVTAIEHDVDAGTTRIDAGDPVPSDEQIIADALNKLK